MNSRFADEVIRLAMDVPVNPEPSSALSHQCFQI